MSRDDRGGKGAIGMKAKMPVAIVAAVLVAACGCSREGREEAMDRMAAAGRALNGGDTEGRTPDVVRRQQEAEARRQNREWTQENQAKHPVEYCQAQLETIARDAEGLGAVAHKIAVEISRSKRENLDDAVQAENLSRFLADAKAAYRAAEAENRWPVQIGGFALPQGRAQEKIVDAARKIPELKANIAARKNRLAGLQKKLDRVNAEQKQLVELRGRVQATLRALETKQVIEDDEGIAAALAAIGDSMGALAPEDDNPSLADLAEPDRRSTLAAEFAAIMAE